MLATLAGRIAVGRAGWADAVASEPDELELAEHVGEGRDEAALVHLTAHATSAGGTVATGALGGEDRLACSQLGGLTAGSGREARHVDDSPEREEDQNGHGPQRDLLAPECGGDVGGDRLLDGDGRSRGGDGGGRGCPGFRHLRAGAFVGGGCGRRLGAFLAASGSGSAFFGAFEQVLGNFGHGSSVDTGVKWGENESFITADRKPDSVNGPKPRRSGGREAKYRNGLFPPDVLVERRRGMVAECCARGCATPASGW
ncbi:unannotated protein [freshwater metagenome]|uniref:Unannotated protein n=1 Tax=freshwater metagenome TaxID=449393 RepID=A0A6J6GBS8_9ZZZZ